MKYIYILVIVLMAGLLLTGCYDKENTIHRLPNLAIGNIANGSVKTGEPIRVSPTCTMGGEEVECTYNWYRYHGSEAELISEYVPFPISQDAGERTADLICNPGKKKMNNT